MGSGLPNLNFEIGFKSHFVHNCPRWYHFTLSFFKCISNAPCILSRNFGSRSRRMASFHSCGIPRLFKTHSNYREFRSSFRESASGLEIVHSRWQSAHAEVDRWCTAGACRACRESRCTMVNVSPPLFAPHFPSVLSPSPRVPR